MEPATTAIRPRPLLDRMEVINLPGYIQEEKLQIGRRFLLPKQLETHGVGRSQVTITTRALREIIEGYAREPGVRGPENHIKKMIRKSVKRIVEEGAKKIRIDRPDVAALLGKRVFSDQDFHKKPEPDVNGARDSDRALLLRSSGSDTATCSRDVS